MTVVFHSYVMLEYSYYSHLTPFNLQPCYAMLVYCVIGGKMGFSMASCNPKKDAEKLLLITEI